MTYSIVARDAATGEVGVAVQSRSFGTGARVPWAMPGVGAVATQSFTLTSYGPLALALLRDGSEPVSALAELVAADELRDYRQVSVLDATGRTAAHTGVSCFACTGTATGEGYSAQGNMLRSDDVVPALAQGFERAQGSLAERLLAGLAAAEAAGGDFRGREAGAILVVEGERGATSDPDPIVDVRVDNHPDPLGELGRLLRISLALRRLRQAPLQEIDAAVVEARAAGVDDDVAVWTAAVMLVADDPEHARNVLAPLSDVDDRWRTALQTAAEIPDA